MTIENTVVNNVESNINFNQIGALQQKRTLAFVNHFVITTTQFLNNFLKNCEFKLLHYERKLEKINACVVLLEDRLSSIPEINDPGLKIDTLNKTNEELEPNSSEPQGAHGPTSTPEESREIKSESEQISPEYMRFVKMAQVGVPLEAVKLKASLEGLDPILIDKFVRK